MDGLLIVDKPLGWSSMDVVRRVRGAAGGVKTGHAGTLDPLATGVVVCCLGKGTRCVDRIMEMGKVYETQIDLSAFTATDDREGARQEVAVATPPTSEAIRAVLDGMTGEVKQRPPAFSAVHVGGQRAYKLARKGRVVDLGLRSVRIDAIEVLDYTYPLLSLRVTCGKGTYIRSIARELGEKLGTGGHLASLRRMSVGRYTLAMAVDERRLQSPLGVSDLLPLPD